MAQTDEAPNESGSVDQAAAALAGSCDFALDEMPGQLLHERLRAAREQGPIQPARFMGMPAFVIAGYDALQRGFLDDETFPGHRMYQHSFEPAIGKSFISNPDPVEHLRERRLVTPALRSRAVTRYEREDLAALANELVDRLAERDEFDLVRDFTARFPYLVITRLLGLPRDREDEFHDWALALLTFRDQPERALEARDALSRFLAPVVEERRRRPQEDVISELAHAEVEGRRLSDDQIFSHVRLLFPTGGETTHGSLGNVLYALMTQQDEWQRLVRDPSRVEAVVLEGLRWETPIAVLPRMSRGEDSEFCGTPIPANSWVLFAIAGANRDPALFDDPDRFDPDRVQPPNLVFGRGRKSCPGIHLAKKNMSVALEVLSRRMPDLALVDPVEAVPRRTVLRSPNALRVRRKG